MPRVAARRLEMADVAAFECLQVTWQMLQLPPQRGGKKARIDEGVALRAQLGRESRMRRGRRREALRQREVFVGDQPELTPCAIDDRRQAGASAFDLFVPRALVAA